MKETLPRLALVLALAAGVHTLGRILAANSIPTGPTSITLAWNYPANQLSTGLVFRVYSSLDITTPLQNWTVLTNVVGTNLFVTLSVQPGARYFSLTASNLWGESDFSNVASTPAVPRSDVDLSVRRP